jgi:hypothetical protein
MTQQTTGPKLTCFRINSVPGMPVVPAGAKRQWMDQTGASFANRCLPLLIANQCGWFIINTHHIHVRWDGGNEKNSLKIECHSGPEGLECPAVSHFGNGVLTFQLNYLFRTSPGYNLWVKGPSNWPKLGIAPLEGIVETDWAVSTFTMNWRMTAYDHPVEFLPGEPIAMLVPMKRGEVETFTPVFREITDEPGLSDEFHEWAKDRLKFNDELEVPGSEAAQRKWQKEYFRGDGSEGVQPPHQVKLDVKEFTVRHKG